jgi:hypothetical protein
MRITRDLLLKNVNDTVAQRTRADRSILSVYLSGSLLGDDYLLGGSADIDLAFIHLDDPSQEREIVRLTDDVHLDIAHYSQKVFRHPRSLRQHPWLGPTIFSCKVIYDPQHFMDFAQASVRGQFDLPETVLSRVHSQLEHARQMWLGFDTQMPPDPGPQDVSRFLRAVDHAANAIASLSGAPLTERRFLLDFPTRAEAINRPNFQPALLGIVGAPYVDAAALLSWLEDWQAAYTALPPASTPARLHPHRRNYYQLAMRAMLQGGQPHAALWPMLRTWSLSTGLLPADSPCQPAWRAACERLGLLGVKLPERIQALDAFLDMAEEAVERWAQSAGA